VVQLAREIIRLGTTLLYEGNGGTPTRMLTSESGFGYPDRQNLIDQIGDPYINLYRKTVAKQRSYVIEMTMTACSPSALDAEIAAWEQTHAPGVQQVLTRITRNGGIFYLDCVPEGPVWSDRGLSSVHVSQSYVAANPWWYGPEQSATANFNNANPVNIAVMNGGNIPTWLRVAISGVVVNPKISVASGAYFVELDWTNGAGEDIVIDCKPPAIITHTVGGVTSSIFGYRTSDSWINRVQAPVGASNVVISAASGVAACNVYWRNRYGALA